MFIKNNYYLSGSPSDPVFYSLHAYIDMLFWTWQNRYAKGNPSIYNEKVLRAVLSPYNTEQKYLLGSEIDLCVSYKSLGIDDHHQDQNYYYNNYDYGKLSKTFKLQWVAENGRCFLFLNGVWVLIANNGFLLPDYPPFYGIG